jgi:small subunit ribosomal protein S1
MAAFIRRICAQNTPLPPAGLCGTGVSLAVDGQPGAAPLAVEAETVLQEPAPACEPVAELAPPAQSAAPEGEEASSEADWRLAEQALDEGSRQNATVVGWNRGGLLVHWHSLQGFLPASQLERMIRYSSDSERDTAFAGRVGEELALRVIEVDRSRKRLVFSERALQWGTGNGHCLWDDLMPGQVRRGRVRNLCEFGAFIDLGGIDGLIHISEIAWRHIRHPSDTLQIGQELDVYVMSVEPERKRVALSLKKLGRDPWGSIVERYRVGQIVEGVISNVLSFGAFVRIEDGIEGLIHISELANGTLAHPQNVVAEGDTVRVLIINIDCDNRRLALSLRQAYEAGESGSTRGLAPASE